MSNETIILQGAEATGSKLAHAAIDAAKSQGFEGLTRMENFHGGQDATMSLAENVGASLKGRLAPIFNSNAQRVVESAESNLSRGA